MAQSFECGNTLHSQYIDFLTQLAGHCVLALALSQDLQDVRLAQEGNDLKRNMCNQWKVQDFTFVKRAKRETHLMKKKKRGMGLGGRDVASSPLG